MDIFERRRGILLMLAVSVLIGIWGDAVDADACQVLVVSSYHESFFYNLEVKEGIEEVLGTSCELTYSYLEALTEPENIETKAKEAFLDYQTIQPDGVIAVGEDAQSSFVLPYLREKVATPVMFNTVFAPEMYEYPASNVSGVILRWPVEEAIVFAQQLAPEIATVGFLFGDEPTAHAVIRQIANEQDRYPVTVLEPILATTAEEAVEYAVALKNQCDALYIGPMSLLPGTSDTAFSSESLLFAAIRKAFGKATLSNLQYYVEAGLLCGVRDFGQEQGQISAEMLQQAMSGVPLAELPLSQNQFGQRVLNKTVLNELGIKPSRRLLTGTEIVDIAQ